MLRQARWKHETVTGWAHQTLKLQSSVRVGLAAVAAELLERTNSVPAQRHQSPPPVKPDRCHREQAEMRELPPRAVVSSRTVFDLIWKLDENAEHDVPLSDHSTFAADDLRLVLNDSTDGVPRVAPFLDLDAFVSNATHDFYDNQHKRLDPVLVPTAVTPELEKHKEGIHPGLCWAVLFHRMCDEFLRIEASRFFSEHETSILQHNPDLVTGMELSYSLLNGLGTSTCFYLLTFRVFVPSSIPFH